MFKSESKLDKHTEEKHADNNIEKDTEVPPNLINESNGSNITKAHKKVFQCDE
jgi:hypothetical protein